MNNQSSTSVRPDRHSPLGTQPGARRGAVRRAMGHNRFASAMLVVLPAVSLIFIGAFFYYSGVLSDLTETELPQSAEPVKVDSKLVKMDSPRIARFDDKGQSYVLTAKTARQHTDNPAVVLLDQITIDMMLKPKLGAVVVTAARGSFDANKKHLLLVGNVRVVSKKGYRVMLSSADVYLEERRISSREPVIIVTPRGTISADTFESNRQKVRLVGNVLFESRDGLRAWLASADADLDAGLIVSKEPVRVEMPYGSVRANGLEISDDGSHIRFFNRTRTVLNAKKKAAR